MDHLIAVSTSIVRKIDDEGRAGAPVSLIYNGIDLERYDQPGAVLHAPRGVRAAGLGADRRGRRPARAGEGPPDADRRLADASSMRTPTPPADRRRGQPARGPRGRRSRRSVSTHSVMFTGRRDDVPAVTKSLDVAVLPSYREAQGLSILEAMALSRPVVASNVGGIPEMIEDGRTGLLVPPHDADALAAAIVRLLTDHPLRRHPRPGRPRHGPRAILRGAHGPRRRDDLRRVDARGGHGSPARTIGPPAGPLPRP